MSESEKNAITEIINLFLKMKSPKKILGKVLPRLLSYIIKHLKIISYGQMMALSEHYPGEFSTKFNELRGAIMRKLNLTLEDFYPILELIRNNRKDLRVMRWHRREKSTKALNRICKVLRISDDVMF